MSFPCYFDKTVTHDLPDRYAPCLSCKQPRGAGCAGDRNCGCPESRTVVLDHDTVAHRMPDRSILLEGGDRMFALTRDALDKLFSDVAGWRIPDTEVFNEPEVCGMCGGPMRKHEVTDYDFGDGREGLFLLCTEKGCARGDNGVACFQLAMKGYDPVSWRRRRKGA